MNTKTTEIKWGPLTKTDFRLIGEIADRAEALSEKHGSSFNRITGAEFKRRLIMDLNAAHCNGCELQLAALLAADDGNFSHDVFGIARHIDRETGQLKDSFLPRYTAK